MRKPDPLIASKPGAEDTEAMANRSAWLEAAYFADGRHLKTHPQHGLFTGLDAKYRLAAEVPDREPEPVCPMPVREPVCPMPKAA